MKATGIVRRIDDLGRVVIPKEIRRTMRIREGDPLEIFTEREGEVIFRKYSPVGDISETAGQLCDAIYKTTGHMALVLDREAVIAAAGIPKKDVMDRRLPPELSAIMDKRKTYRYSSGDSRISIGEEVAGYYVGVAVPIISGGDLMGCVVLALEGSGSPLDEAEQQLAQTVSSFLGKQLED